MTTKFYAIKLLNDEYICNMPGRCSALQTDPDIDWAATVSQDKKEKVIELLQKNNIFQFEFIEAHN